ncbi:SDR family NAD(P)-dependent oxidoreductase [Pseudonocardia acaciae]|uniref:SDR family NAD(P)-dependent oxidoreductase n=1 Tax=Pseudonocardia acaciae TaxID=551276 RepID=UPI00048A74E9|nr:SDR family oxidoreductase [Pseudonocardia acaciae]
MSEAPVGVVTGAGSGIGRAAAERLLADGARIAGWDRRAESLSWLDGTPDAITEAVDVTDAEQVSAAAAAVGERWGRVDFVVNSAGIFLVGPVAEVAPEAVRTLFDVNVVGTTVVTQALLPMLVASRGAVVNLSSTVGLRASATNAHYAASKAAVAHLTRCWALELAPHRVRVNALAPGPIGTEIYTSAGMDPDAVRALLERRAADIPLGRVGTTAEVALWISRLIADEWVTGQVIAVDGGMSVG